MEQLRRRRARLAYDEAAAVCARRRRTPTCRRGADLARLRLPAPRLRRRGPRRRSRASTRRAAAMAEELGASTPPEANGLDGSRSR